MKLNNSLDLNIQDVNDSLDLSSEEKNKNDRGFENDAENKDNFPKEICESSINVDEDNLDLVFSADEIIDEFSFVYDYNDEEYSNLIKMISFEPLNRLSEDIPNNNSGQKQTKIFNLEQ